LGFLVIRRSRLAGGMLLMVAVGLGSGAVLGQATRPSTQPVTHGAITDREKALWTEIERLQRALGGAMTGEAWFEQARAARQQLLAKLQLYQTLYPGGARRDALIRAELGLRFELATLGEGSLEALEKRVAEILAHPPSRAAEAEAAYWRLMCAQIVTESSPESLATLDLQELDGALRVEMERYLDAYPGSPRALSLAERLFRAAQRAGDQAGMRRALEHVRAHFPDHPHVEELEGRWRRIADIGKPVELAFEREEGVRFDVRTRRGKVVIVVVWASFHEGSRALVRQIDDFVAVHPDVDAVGVNLDATRAEMEAARGALGVAWPQWCEETGWGHTFARAWGVRELPEVCVIDRAGRLAGWTQPAGAWQALVRDVLRDGSCGEGAASRPSGAGS
jgi:hypothetical protein